jgi:hypothetical protein
MLGFGPFGSGAFASLFQAAAPPPPVALVLYEEMMLAGGLYFG